MSPFIEFEGRNVERAITKACEVLKIPRDQLKHDVICFGATGIFGLVGIKKARIRVSAPGIRNAEMSPPAEESGHLIADAPAISPPTEKTVSETQDESVLVSAALGRQALQKLVDAVTCGAEIVVSSNSRQIVYTVSGGDPAALIGKRGQTIEAIQYLLKKIVNKSTEDRTRIIVDIAGHAFKRQNDLQALAMRSAENVCQNGKAVTIGRFNPQDRKIIHLALKNDLRIKTQSKGEGYLKKLVVFPRGE